MWLRHNQTNLQEAQTFLTSVVLQTNFLIEPSTLSLSLNMEIHPGNSLFDEYSIWQLKRQTASDVNYIGVDVGSSSARAALVDKSGHVVKSASQTIRIWNERTDHYEQSTEDIWNACCAVVKEVAADVDVAKIKGIGFDATCSLVVLDKDFQPLPVNQEGACCRNVMMWMDHRAGAQATRINQTKHRVLNYTGGQVSIEMEMPKLLWLKENLPGTWSRVGHVFDLPDYLTWRASCSLSRSVCSLACKWNYQCDGHAQYWPDDFLKLIGLDDLIHDNYSKMGRDVLPPGAACGFGVTKLAADELGLSPGTAVAASIIDAHAGALGCLAAVPAAERDVDIESRLAIICGTSTCHMIVSPTPHFVGGVWGPYHSSIVPGLWTNEAGQSAAGKLIDHIIETHPAYPDLVSAAGSRHLHSELNDILNKMADGGHIGFLTRRLHVYPDFHGNRSPLADPNMRGMISGLTLSREVTDLALFYLATIQALAYSTRQIIESMTSEGHVIKSITACGGLSKNVVYIQTHADATGLPITLPRETESVLLGSAILASVAASSHDSVQGALRAIRGDGDVIRPAAETRSYHEKKYLVYLAMMKEQISHDDVMNGPD